MHAPRPATLTEVASLAGVSVTTASKAINGRDRISEATRKRVLRAARDLSYAPNLIAKSLASGRSSIIGVLLRDPMVHRFAMPIVVGAQSVLEQREFSAIIADARGVVDRLSELAIVLRQRNVDGLLIVNDNQGETPSISASAEIPCVYVHGPTTNSRDVVHVLDDYAGAVAITDHLLGIGRTRGPYHRPQAIAGRPATRPRCYACAEDAGPATRRRCEVRPVVPTLGAASSPGGPHRVPGH